LFVRISQVIGCEGLDCVEWGILLQRSLTEPWQHRVTSPIITTVSCQCCKPNYSASTPLPHWLDKQFRASCLPLNGRQCFASTLYFVRKQWTFLPYVAGLWVYDVTW